MKGGLQGSTGKGGKNQGIKNVLCIKRVSVWNFWEEKLTVKK